MYIIITFNYSTKHLQLLIGITNFKLNLRK